MRSPMRRQFKTNYLARTFATLCIALGSIAHTTSVNATSIKFETIALSGTQAPAAGGANFLSFGDPELNNARQTAFFTFLNGTGVNTGNDAAIIKGDVSALQILAREGDIAPGTSGAAFSRLGTLDLNNNGDTAFNWALTGTGVTGQNDRAIFKEANGQIELVVREGDPVPGVANVQFNGFGNSSSANTPGINDQGNTIIEGSFNGQAANSFSSGLFEETNGSLNLVLQRGDPAPGVSGTEFVIQVDPSHNNVGDIAFRGSLRGPGIDFSNENAVFKKQDGTVSITAREGETAPGSSETFSSFSAIRINDAGDTAFNSRFTNSNDTGIFKEQNGQLELVAKSGDSPPGIDNAVFSLVRGPAINNVGDTAFVGKFAGTSVTDANDEALFAEKNGVLELIIREGDLLEVLEGDLRTIAFFSFLDGFNDQGDLAFRANFTDGTQAIIVTSKEISAVPLPAPIFLLVTGLFALAGITRSRKYTFAQKV